MGRAAGASAIVVATNDGAPLFRSGLHLPLRPDEEQGRVEFHLAAESPLCALRREAPFHMAVLFPSAPALAEISFSLSGAYLSPSAQAEARMINFASSQRLSSTLAPPEIPCIRLSRLTVASRSTSCATVVRDGHAYWLNG